jgi:CRP/FNR family transcriptional regulator, cyclic AMP receptor protein
MAHRRGSLKLVSPARIPLLQADADIGRYLTAEERTAAEALAVPCITLETGHVDIRSLLDRHACFGALVVSGMLVAHLRVGEQAGMRILGPGDVVSGGTSPASMLLVDSGCRAVSTTQLAMLGKDVLVGAHRWPRLVAGLHARTTEQIERVAVQLAICQLPRVEDRLLALFWLLAEQWGRVTPGGTVLPLALTHETLGALVGARRPTVTLALGELADRGAVLRQGRAWLLVEPLTRPTRQVQDPHAPSFVADTQTTWGTRELRDIQHDVQTEIFATVARLREQHLERSEAMRVGLERARASRLRSQEIREGLRTSRQVTPEQAPSSG